MEVHEFGGYTFILSGFEAGQLRKFLQDSGRKTGLRIRVRDRELLFEGVGQSVGLRFYDNTDDRGR